MSICRIRSASAVYTQFLPFVGGRGMNLCMRGVRWWMMSKKKKTKQTQLIRCEKEKTFLNRRQCSVRHMTNWQFVWSMGFDKLVVGSPPTCCTSHFIDVTWNQICAGTSTESRRCVQHFSWPLCSRQAEFVPLSIRSFTFSVCSLSVLWRWRQVRETSASRENCMRATWEVSLHRVASPILSTCLK